MMRAWENRVDCFVCDEPLYSHYLKVTGLAHPGAAEVIAHHESDWREVVKWLTAPENNSDSAPDSEGVIKDLTANHLDAVIRPTINHSGNIVRTGWLVRQDTGNRRWCDPGRAGCGD